ncbi:MAG: AMP-binding protein, partial [Anaerolineae bacterium]
MNAAHLLSNRARLTPDREALVYLPDDDRYTYAELDARANRLANAMRDLGVEKGDRVSILAHNSVPSLDLFYGLPRIGAIFAPLNWRLVARELVYIVNDCEPDVLICGPEFVDVLEEMGPEIDVPHIVSLEGAQIEGALEYDTLLSRAQEAPPDQPRLEADD